MTFMRIAYGIHGYSRGHATRALPVLEALSRRHELVLFAGGDAYEMLRGCFPIERIPCLGFVYERGRRSNWGTMRANLPKLLELLRRGPSVGAVLGKLREFRPDALISDAEPWTHLAGSILRVPRIGFDHFGILVHCRVALPVADWCKGLFDRCTYRWLMRDPERVLVSSFFKAPAQRRGVRVVGPILRERLASAGASNGAHLVAYFNQGSVQLSAPALDALAVAGPEIRLYGTQQHGSHGNVHFKPPGLDSFIEDLAGCRAVISTAGNQLVGEAMVLGKPLLVVPEATVEQRLNAREIVRLGIGEQILLSQLTPGAIERFLERTPLYAQRCRAHAHDGRHEAIQIIEHWIAELSRRSPSPALSEVAA
jgi:uncharacterized protein (TIGR00661 family)